MEHEQDELKPVLKIAIQPIEEYRYYLSMLILRPGRPKPRPDISDYFFNLHDISERN